MTYAARDAQVSVAVFLRLLGLLSEASPASSSGSSYSDLAACCQGLVDVPFRGRGDCDNRAADGERRQRTQKTSTPECSESGDQQVPDPRKNNKRKPLGVGYSARSGCTVCCQSLSGLLQQMEKLVIYICSVKVPEDCRL